jgi:hypothetical protein
VENATSYDVQITSRTVFDAPEFERTGITDTVVEISGLRSGTPYAWRVVASAPEVAGTWSDTTCFTTVVPPGRSLVPVLPLNGATDVWPAGTLVYTTSAEYIAYEIVVDNDPDFGSPEFRTESPFGTCSFSDLKPGTKYFWKVKGILPGERRVEGPPARFRVQGTSSTDEQTDSGSGVESVHRYGNVVTISFDEQVAAPVSISVYTLQGRMLNRIGANSSDGVQQFTIPQTIGPVLIVVSSPTSHQSSTAYLR